MPNAPLDLLEAIGANMRNIRRQAGLTQEDVGHATGIPVGSLSEYENGRVESGAGNLLKIAWALGVDVGAFFADIEPVDFYDEMTHRAVEYKRERELTKERRAAQRERKRRRPT